MSLNDLGLREISPLVLAFLGDAVWEMYVRNRVVEEEGVRCRVNALHLKVSKFVKASSQAALVKLMSDEFFTQSERDIVRKGRNARPGHVNKSSSRADYCTSTGFEALLGYLYLSKNEERLLEVMKQAYDEGMRQEQSDI